MGERRRCSKIAVMQLFHELKQQFPTLPDHVVSDCIVQSGHERESCARSLRAHRDGRGPLGAFPPGPAHHQAPRPSSWTSSGESSANCDPCQPLSRSSDDVDEHRQEQRARIPVRQVPRPHSLDIDCGIGERCQSNRSDRQRRLAHQPFSAPPAFLDEAGPRQQLTNSRFELNVNVSCGGSPVVGPTCAQDPFYNGSVARHHHHHHHHPHVASSSSPSGAEVPNRPSSTGRSCTTVSLSLRSPSSEPPRQAPFEVSSSYQQQLSAGSSIRASNEPPSSHQDSGDCVDSEPGVFRSRLQISIGRSARGKTKRPTSLLAFNPMAAAGNEQRPPGLPMGPSSQPVRPSSGTSTTSATARSAPSTPSAPALNFSPSPGGSLPSTPISPPAPRSITHISTGRSSLGAIPRRVAPPRPEAAPRWPRLKPESLALVDQVENQFKSVVMEQLIRKERLMEALEAEKSKLEAMRKEVESLSNLSDGNISSQDEERKLRHDIYRLQLECDRLSKEVDTKSDRGVPLGETSKEFYQSIYTGQQYTPTSSSTTPPPLPSQPPAWQPEPNRDTIEEDADGPSWVCQRCTFDNHPLMNKCEQCDMPKQVETTQGMNFQQMNQQFATSMSRFSSIPRG